MWKTANWPRISEHWKSLRASGSVLPWWIYLKFQITKAALVITVIFIVTFSYNLWYYLLGTLNLVDPSTYNYHQAQSQWGTSFNCFINPIVYIIVMTTFVRSVKKTFCICCPQHSDKSNNSRSSKLELSSNVSNVSNTVVTQMSAD